MDKKFIGGRMEKVNNISISTNTSFNPSLYSEGFIEHPLDNPKIITEHVWSPIVFKDGIRRSSHFRASYWGGLDFDDGLYTLERACREWSDSAHVIGTTKSHMKSKGGVVCDRFRLLFRWSEPVTSPLIYQYSMNFMVRQYDCDRACRDLARFFFPCTEIVSYNFEGYNQEIVTKNPSLDSTHEKTKDYYKRIRGSGIVPPWIKEILTHGVGTSGRNTTCYRVAATLAELGFSLEQTVSLIAASPLISNSPPAHTLAEAQRTINNGYKRGLTSGR